VLVLAVMNGEQGAATNRRAREMIFRHLKPIMEAGPKLKTVLGMYGMPVQLRSLRPACLSISKWDGIKMLAKIPPSTLAQSIPEEGQGAWLRGIDAWASTMKRRFSGQDQQAEWAARNIPHDISGLGAGDIADFVGTLGRAFNPKWTWQRVLSESERWHADLAKKNESEQFVARYGFAWDHPMDYGTLPVEVVTKTGERVVALRSGADIFLEGKVMHHCVASYIRNVVSGNCRLYSVRDRDDNRLATFELDIEWPKTIEGIVRDKGKLVSWKCVQIKGPYNQPATVPAMHAMAELLRRANENGE